MYYTEGDVLPKYENPTFDTDERTCYNGHIIGDGDDERMACPECEEEQRYWT